MADKDQALEIVVRAKDQASAALRGVQQNAAAMARGIGQSATAGAQTMRDKQRAAMEAILADTKNFSRQQRDLMAQAYRWRFGVEPPKIELPKVTPPKLPDIGGAIKQQARDAMVSFSGATRSINLLGAGALMLRGPLGIALGLVTTLGGAAISVFKSIIGAVIQLAQAILAHAVAALRTLAIAFAAATTAAAGFAAVTLKLGLAEINFARDQKTALAVMLGSSAAAKDLYGWMQRLAESLRIDPRPVVEAGRKMTAFGMNVKQILPWALDLAAAMKEPIDAVAEMLGRVEMEQALMRSLAGMGIGKKRLMSVGVEFKGEQIVNRAQLMAGIETIVTRDFPKMAARGAGQLGRIWQGIKNKITNIAADLSEASYGVLQKAGENLLASWERLSKSAAWATIKEKLGGALAFIAQWIADLIARAPELATRIAAMLDRAPIANFLSTLMGLGTYLWTTFKAIISAVADFISARLGGAGITVSGVFRAAAIAIMRAFTIVRSTIDTLIERWPNIVRWVKETAAAVADGIWGVIAPTLSLIEGISRIAGYRGPGLEKLEALVRPQPQPKPAPAQAAARPREPAAPPPPSLSPRAERRVSPGPPSPPQAAHRSPLPAAPPARQQALQSGILLDPLHILDTIGAIGKHVLARLKAQIAELGNYRVVAGPTGQIEMRHGREAKAPGWAETTRKADTRAEGAPRYAPGLAGLKTMYADFAANWKSALADFNAQIPTLFPEIKMPDLAEIVKKAEEDLTRALAKGGAALGESLTKAVPDFTHEVWGATHEMLKKAGLTPAYYESIAAPIAHVKERAAAAIAPAKDGSGAGAASTDRESGLNRWKGQLLATISNGLAAMSQVPNQASEAFIRARSAIAEASLMLARTGANVAQPPPAVAFHGLTPAGGAPLAFAGAGGAIPLDVTVNLRGEVTPDLRSPAARRDLERMMEQTVEEWARRSGR